MVPSFAIPGTLVISEKTKKKAHLTRDLSSKVVGAHSNIGRVGGSIGSVSNGVAESSVGGSNSTISIAKSSIAKSSIAKTGISKSMVSKTIWVSISSIKDSSLSISIGLSLSLTLLATTWNRGSKIISADANVGRVGQTEGSGSDGMAKSSISKTMVSSISKGIRISVSTIESSGISLRLSLSLTLLSSVQTMSIRVASIGKWSSSTRDRYISGVHTWGRLATESIGTIGIGEPESIAEPSVQESRVGLSLAVHGSNKGRCNNKELIHFVR